MLYSAIGFNVVWHSSLIWISDYSCRIVIFSKEFTLCYDQQASVHISGIRRQIVTITDTSSTDNTRWFRSVQGPRYALTPAAFDGTFQGTPQWSIGIILTNKISWIPKYIKIQRFKIRTINNKSKTKNQALKNDCCNKNGHGPWYI